MSDDPRGDMPDAFAGWEDVPLDDPRVLALGPAARARLRAYHAFMAGEAPEGARVEDAERRLAEAIEHEIGVPLEPGATTTRRSPAPVQLERSAGWRSWFAPPARPVWAVALVLAVAGTSLWYASERRAPGGPVLRGNPTPAPLATRTSHLADGGVRLEWAPLPGAEGYAIVFLSADLSERARVRDLHDTHFDLRAGANPPGLPSGAQVLWRVIALRGGDEIERSPATSVRVP
jgi:hypothetical protein